MKRTKVKKLALLFTVFCVMSGSAWGTRAIRVIGDLSIKNSELGAYRALLIGIDDYKDRNIPDLKTPVKDVKAVSEVLTDRYGFKNFRLILNQEATRERIISELRSLIEKSRPEDSVLVYYAGHGDQDKLTRGGWWIPSDAKAGNPATYIDNSLIQRIVAAMKTRHVLVISDSCYSGTLFGTYKSAPPVIDDKYYLGLFNEKSRWAMTSGNKTPVADFGSEGHSIFAYQLVKALEKNERPYFSAHELYDRIAPIVANNSEQMPMCGPIMYADDQGGQFIFLAQQGAEWSEPAPPGRGRQQRLGHLEVRANADGARVYVSGKDVGEAPAFVPDVPSGTVRVRIVKDGYEPWEKDVEVDAGRKRIVRASLTPVKPKPARLYVRTDPADATVRILNISPRFVQGMELRAGRYHLQVTSEEYEDHEEWIELSAGEDRDVEVRLTPLPEKPVVSGGRAGEPITDRIGGAEFKFAYIPPGTFTMGSPAGEPDRDNDETQHEVTLSKGFHMQTTEITQGQWKAVMGSNPSYFKNCGDDCPVEQVSWNDCQEFIKKLNRLAGSNRYRLPTEAEWEYAARAGTSTPFAFGDCLSTDQANYDGNYPLSGCRKGEYRKTPIRVGSLSANAWRLYDMHGNVWEWCQDWKGDYPRGAVTDPTGPSSGSNRVFRGGSWYFNARNCRSANRISVTPDYRNNGLGARLVRSYP